jgi:hypothetical protein
MSSNWKFETHSVHAGYSPDPTTKAVAGVYELLCKRPIGRKLLHFKGIA